MASGDNDKRLYSEKEIGALIQRATEIQKGRHAGNHSGLSLQEVGEIAAEFGIDASSLRAAAMELENTASKKGLLGGPFSINMVRVLEGHYSDETWDEVVEAIRETTGSRGRSRLDGRERVWSREIKDLNTTLDQILVSIREKDENTILKGRRGYAGLAFIGYMFSAMIGGMTAGIMLDGGGLPVLVNLLLVITGGAVGMAAFRSLLGVWVRGQKARLRTLIDNVQSVLGAAEAAPAIAPPIATGQLADVDELDDVLGDELGEAGQPIKRKVAS